ncbi:CDK-activating kinase assembly factor [Xylariaceae sp. FL0804]|nr:CDK-activating kinase assembly factor [Xylariaceae sp. FL0804]
MSRKPPAATTVVKPTSAPATALPSDICPVCKRVRYLNTDMEFLINPECYHPMCSNCVTNIFKSGPAQCPYASCVKTLRHRGFRSAFFGDLTVEREVDIRRRVAQAFNQAEDDFETLRDYNNYLQDVEDLTFDLIDGGDAERQAADDKLRRHEQLHRDEIERNRRRGRDAEQARRRRDADQADAARRRRQEEQREDARARAEEATVNAEVMDALARGEPGSAAEIQERIVAAKRARVAQITTGGNASLSSLSLSANNDLGDDNDALNDGRGSKNDNNLLSIRGLKTRRADDEDLDAGPYDPFAGLSLEPRRYQLHLQPQPPPQQQSGGDRDARAYPNSWLDDARSRDDHRVPGYSAREYVARALFDAFAGLGVAVADEKADPPRAAGTRAADDVFG